MNRKTLSRIALGFGISLLVSGAAILLLVPGSERVAMAQGVIGVVATAVYFVVNKGALGRTFGGRATWFYGLSAVIAVLLLGGLVAVNYISAQKKVSWDLTEAGLYTLSSSTIDALGSIEEKVKVTAYYGSADPAFKTAKELLDRYTKETDKLTVEFVDPEKNPQLASQDSITANGPRIIFSHAGKEARAKAPTEEELTNALLKVLRTSEKKIYFTSGHGEVDIEDASTQRGYAKIVKRLGDEGLEVQTLNLVSGSIPDDAAAIAIVGPQKPFLEPEVQAVRDYLSKGGHLYIALEPGTDDPGLRKLMDWWGFLYDDALVVDPLSKLMGGGDAIPVVQQYAEQAITKNFNLMTVFPTARPVVARGDAEPRPTILALTNPTAWGETDWRSGTAKLDPDEKRGAQGIMAVLSKKKDDMETRIVAVGDVDFANNQYESVAGNGDLFLNSFNWLASQEKRITIRPKQRAASRLMLTDADARFLNFFSISAMPMLILAAGLSVWLVRRSK